MFCTAAFSYQADIIEPGAMALGQNPGRIRRHRVGVHCSLTVHCADRGPLEHTWTWEGFLASTTCFHDAYHPFLLLPSPEARTGTTTPSVTDVAAPRKMQITRRCGDLASARRKPVSSLGPSCVERRQPVARRPRATARDFRYKIATRTARRQVKHAQRAEAARPVSQALRNTQHRTR